MINQLMIFMLDPGKTIESIIFHILKTLNIKTTQLIIMPHWLKNNIVLIPLLAVITFVLYANTLNSPFALDDYHNIIANKPIRITELSIEALNGIIQDSLIERRPVANISLALNYYFHQYDVSGYHHVNIVIHILNGIFFFLFVQFTLNFASGVVSQKHKNLIAFSAALLWLVHPLQTQSVTYIIQRMNSLATMFYLLSFVCYIRARINANKLMRFILACGSLTAGILAIGSKENGVMLPVFILLYEWFFFQDLRLNLRKHHYVILALLMMFLLGAVFFYLGPNPLKALTNYGGRDFTLEERLLTQLRVVIFYITVVLLPLPSRLTLEHDFPLSYSFLLPATTLFSLLALIGILFAALFLAKRERIFSFCLLWFLGNLFIESSFIPLEIIFEHRTYLPSMMLILLVVLVVYRLIANNLLKALLLVATVILLSSATYARNSIWENELSLWTDIAEKAPKKARAQMNLGIILSKEGRMDEATTYLTRAVQLDPDYDLGYYSLGDLQMKQGKFIAASKSYQKAVQIKPSNNLARFNLGKALAAAGKHQNAVFHYKRAAGRDPFISHQIYYFMGNSLYHLGRFPEAINAYTSALQLQPNYMEARKALVNTRKLMEVLQKKQPANTQ
jgi:tetratricopeptide (TPR) repeat protein